jgi:SAM-dependent methyltransferase
VAVEPEVARHYGTGGLLDRIRAGLRQAGIDPDRARPADLKPVDEFHIGGAAATEALIDQAQLRRGMRVLDIGCGIGGTARLIAERAAAEMTGIDLTDEFVRTASALSATVGLGDRTRFRTGSALDMPFGDDSFDAALLLHVGMNIADKRALMAEAARVLRPGAPFLLYEVMRTGEGELDFPVPWASTPATSFVATPAQYREAAQAAGFEVAHERERRGFALDFFARMQARIAESGPPPLGIHLFMGATAREKIANMVANIQAGRIAPVEMILRKPA